MATILRETEGEPAAGWPAVAVRFPTRPTDADNPEVAQAATWRRLESWIARRWPARTVEIIVEGPGEWSPRLTPFTLVSAEIWDDGWSAATLAPGPLGFVLDAETYRIVGTAGDNATPPADVLEAFKRLHEFNLGVATSWWTEAADYATDGSQRPAAWAAKAIHLSGAADLLRPYRGLR